MNKKLFYSTKDLILYEIDEILSSVSFSEVEKFMESILKANKVFVVGAGRVMFVASAFAKRVNHLGIKTYVVGETTVPPANKNDLLVACSSSGETASVIAIAQVAKKHNLRIAVITSRKESTLAKLSDLHLIISAPTKLRFGLKKDSKEESSQPLGNLFEQSLLIFLDTICILIKEKLGISEKEMWNAHANLE